MEEKLYKLENYENGNIIKVNGKTIFSYEEAENIFVELTEHQQMVFRLVEQ